MLFLAHSGVFRGLKNKNEKEKNRYQKKRKNNRLNYHSNDSIPPKLQICLDNKHTSTDYASIIIWAWSHITNSWSHITQVMTFSGRVVVSKLRELPATSCNQFASSIAEPLQHRPFMPQHAGARVSWAIQLEMMMASVSLNACPGPEQELWRNLVVTLIFSETNLAASYAQQTSDLALQLPSHVLYAIQEN